MCNLSEVLIEQVREQVLEQVRIECIQLLIKAGFKRDDAAIKALKVTKEEYEKAEEELNEMTQILDKGIDDIEANRELPIDDAFKLIEELVEKRKREKA